MRETRLTVHYSSAEQRAAAAERHARRQARRMVQVRAHHDARGDRRAAARQAGARAHVRVGSLPALTTDARLARSQVVPRVGAGGAGATCTCGRATRGRSRRCQPVQGSNFFAPAAQLLARWPACERARSRPPHHTPAFRVGQPPAARRSSHALRRKWIGRFVSTPLCLYAAMSLRRYVATLLCRYAAMSLRRYASFRLCRYVAVPRDVHTRV